MEFPASNRFLSRPNPGDPGGTNDAIHGGPGGLRWSGHGKTNHPQVLILVR